MPNDSNRPDTAVITSAPAEPQRSNLSAHFSLVTVQALFGSLPVIAKIVLTQMSPVALVGFRIGITAVILFIFQLLRRRIFLQHRADYLCLAVLSIFGITLNQLLFIGGLSLTKAVNTSLLAVTIPIFTLGVGALAGRESVSGRKIFGIVLAAAGVLILIDPRKASFSSETTIGDLLIVLNSLSYSIYVAFSKEVITRNGAFRSMMWVFIFAAAVCVPLGLWSFNSSGPATVTGTTWLLVIYIAVGATAATYLLNAFALSRLNASIVAVYIYLQPIIGFVLAAAVLREGISFTFLAAAALVFAGVYLTTRRSTPPEHLPAS